MDPRRLRLNRLGWTLLGLGVLLIFTGRVPALRVAGVVLATTGAGGIWYSGRFWVG